MVFSGPRYPGGAPAWVPSLILLLGECKADNREKISGRWPAPATSIGTLTLMQLMTDTYGKSLATDLHRILLAYDAYPAWRLTMDLATLDDAAQERIALQAAQHPVTLMSILNELADSNGKTKMLIVYIIPRFIGKLSNLWKYSTAKLEARRNKSCKFIVRRQTCPRKRSVAQTERIICKRRGSGREKRNGVVVEGTTKFQKS
eukprot:555303-Pleurochrysis_carterae.AAC.2